MKKYAFTLAEVIIVMIIIGILTIILARAIRTDKFSEKANIAKAYKAINSFSEAATNIKDNQTYCPMGSLIYKIKADGAYSYDYGINLPSSNKEQAVVNMFADYMKFEKTGLDFCEFSGYCSKGAITNSAVRFSNDIYAGIQVLSAIADCPDFKLPDGSQVTQRAGLLEGKPKCWAKLYIDVNGLDGPNQEGKDVFIFGLDADGVNH